MARTVVVVAAMVWGVAACSGRVVQDGGREEVEMARADIIEELGDFARLASRAGFTLVRARGVSFGCSLSAPADSGTAYNASLHLAPSEVPVRDQLTALTVVMVFSEWKGTKLATSKRGAVYVTAEGDGVGLIVQRELASKRADPDSGPLVGTVTMRGCVTSDESVTDAYAEGENIPLSELQ